MSAPEEASESLRLADYLADLREELDEAQSRAAGSSLHLGVDEVTVTLEVAVTTDRKASGSGKVSAKFWVLNAEVGAGGERSSQRIGTQQLTLTLKPRVESVTVDERGRVSVTSRKRPEHAGEPSSARAGRRDRRPVRSRRAVARIGVPDRPGLGVDGRARRRRRRLDRGVAERPAGVGSRPRARR